MGAVRSGEMGLREAGRHYGIPVTTLKRRLEGGNKIAVDTKKQNGRPPVLPSSLEDELAQHILQMEQMFFGFTRKDVRKLAFQLAERNSIPHDFNVSMGMAGKDWLNRFLKRHSQICVREPQQTSLDRATGFNPEQVSRFFDILEELYDSNGFDGTRVFNMDETGISTVQQNTTKILGQKGKKQIGCLSSAERGSNTTIACCFSASGQYVPPLILFKGARLPRDLQDGAPQGSVVLCNESGWMTQETFLLWLKHFIATVNPTPERKVLLVLDGHTSHTTNLEAIDLAREKGVVLLSLPPHCSHRMQPLDVCFFRPLKMYFAQEQDGWMRNHFGKKITRNQLPCIFSAAYTKAASMGNAVNAFAKTGIFPCNRNVFTQDDFVPSMRITDSISPVQVESTAEQPPESCSTTERAPGSVPTAERDPGSVPTAQRAPGSVSTAERAPIPTAQRAPGSVPTAERDPGSVPIAERDPGSVPTAERDPGSVPTAERAPVELVFNTIETNPDGRCFFRSVVTSLSSKLQEGARDTNHLLIDPILRAQEQSQSDRLRADVIHYMCEHYNEFDDIQAAAKSDMPSGAVREINSIQDRIFAMAEPCASVGELEITCTAEVIKRPIYITQDRSSTLVKYKENFNAVPVFLLFTAFGDNAGHYDCLLPSNEATEHSIPVLGSSVHESGDSLAAVRHSAMQQSTPQQSTSTYVHVIDVSPIPTFQHSQSRRGKRKKSEVLTSSPYKKGLLDSASRKTATKQNRKQNQQKKNTRKKNSAQSSWFCFMCSENVQEDMVRCMKCLRWVHEACAGVVGRAQPYTCEMCQ